MGDLEGDQDFIETQKRIMEEIKNSSARKGEKKD